MGTFPAHPTNHNNVRNISDLTVTNNITASGNLSASGTSYSNLVNIGGVAIKTAEESKIFSKNKGHVKFSNLKIAAIEDGSIIALNRNGEIILVDEKDREIEKYIIPAGSVLKVKEGGKVKPRDLIAQWDPHNVPIIAGKSGKIRYEEIIKGETMLEERDPRSGIMKRSILEHKGELHPQLVIVDNKGVIQEVHPIPEKAYIEVNEGDKIKAGVMSLGGSLSDIVRTRVYLQNAQDCEAVSLVHGRYFGEVCPANATFEISQLIDDYLVEIEAEAIIEE